MRNKIGMAVVTGLAAAGAICASAAPALAATPASVQSQAQSEVSGTVTAVAGNLVTVNVAGSGSLKVDISNAKVVGTLSGGAHVTVLGVPAGGTFKAVLVTVL